MWLRVARAQSWLSLSRTEGVLPPPTSVKKEGHTIVLTLLAARPDVYSTYLLLDTVGDPASVKIIRVTMEVRLAVYLLPFWRPPRGGP